MTEEQKLFDAKKKEVARLDEIEKGRPLTFEERENRDKIKMILFEKVEKYGIQLMNAKIRNCDAKQDIRQDFAVTFFENISAYDPKESTPTTYFRSYFLEVIFRYLRQGSHLSQYDAHNVSLVNRAIREYESQGLYWDEYMLSSRTGLSLKVVKNTLHFANCSVYVDLDAALALGSKEPTPEEYYIHQEFCSVIYEALCKSLNEFEFEFLVYKINLEGKTQRRCCDVAKYFGMSVSGARKCWNNILEKLRQNEFLLQYCRQD